MGARRLAQTLAGQRLLGDAQLASALQRQKLIGGSLDTNLLELQLLREPALLSAMAQAFDMEAADEAQLGAIGTHLARLFPLSFAQQYSLVPMRLHEQTLVAACAEPLDEDKRQRIWEAYHLHVTPKIAVEARVRQVMQRLYGVAPEPRYTQLLTLLDGFHAMGTDATLAAFGIESITGAGTATGVVVGTPTEPWAAADGSVAQGADTPHFGDGDGDGGGDRGTDSDMPGLLVPAGLDADAPAGDASMGDGLPTDAAAASEAAETSATRFLEIAASSAARRPLREALASIEAEPNRDRAIAVIIAFAHAMFDYVGVFVVHGRRPHGWRSAGADAIERIHAIDPHIIRDSVVHTVCETQSPYLGPLPKHAANARFLQHIQRRWPKVACLTPILVGGRMAALVYADNGDKQVSPRKVAALMTLLQRCGMVWERLIRSRKYAAPISSRSLSMASDAMPDAALSTAAYVMFSDIGDTPQQSLGDWQDVFKEVARQDAIKTTLHTPKPMPQWSDVIALARSASACVPRLAHPPHADLPHMRHLLGMLDGASVAGRQSATAQLLNLGSHADAICQEAFPGKMFGDIWASDAPLPAFEHCSPLCQLLAKRGPAASAVVLPHLASDDKTKRLMAVYFFQAVHDPAGCAGLTLCLYDGERRIRQQAVQTLRHYRNDLAYAYTIQVLRQQLGEPAGQRFAIQTLGQLREIFAVPALIPLVASKDADVARAAASALAVICGQAFGDDVARWQTWWQGHHYQPRPAWLLAGLSHASPTIRRVVHHELQHITGQVLDFDPQASAQEREQRAQVWQHWLRTHDLDAHWHPTTRRA